ncbi:hypothetical protein AGMMS49992_07280 [Clostridia bacterium]|nr:hypothetical protein AGMMS49992_07280 [Clostridia bacterium]
MADNNVREFINLPNILTSLRIVLIGVFIWLFFAGYFWFALGVFALAGLTDMLDGYFARTRNQITWLGKLLDPIADKLMVCAALVCLAARGWAPWWLLIIVAVKESLMVIGGLILLRKGIVIQALPIGKAATAAFLAAIAATFFHEYTAPIDFALQCAACALTLAALGWYAVVAYKSIKTNAS